MLFYQLFLKSIYVHKTVKLKNVELFHTLILRENINFYPK